MRGTRHQSPTPHPQSGPQCARLSVWRSFRELSKCGLNIVVQRSCLFNFVCQLSTQLRKAFLKRFILTAVIARAHITARRERIAEFADLVECSHGAEAGHGVGRAFAFELPIHGGHALNFFRWKLLWFARAGNQRAEFAPVDEKDFILARTVAFPAVAALAQEPERAGNLRVGE